MGILRFQNRHIGGIVWLSELSVTHTHTHTNWRTHTHWHTDTHTHAQTLIHTNSHSHTLTHTHLHAHTLTNTLTHTFTSANMVRCCQFPINISFNCLKFCTSPIAVAYYTKTFSSVQWFVLKSVGVSFTRWERKNWATYQRAVAGISMFKTTLDTVQFGSWK